VIETDDATEAAKRRNWHDVCAANGTEGVTAIHGEVSGFWSAPPTSLAGR